MGNAISLISANSTHYYCAVYQNNQEIVYPHLIEKQEANKYINEFKELNPIIDNFDNLIFNQEI